MALLCVCSCSNKLEQSKRIAEKGLKELGSGKYAGEYLLGKYFNFQILYLYHSPYFGNYEVRNREAELFMENGRTSSEVNLDEVFFATNYLFDEISFVDSQEYYDDFYSPNFITNSMKERWAKGEGNEEQEMEIHRMMMEMDKKKPGYYQVGENYCYKNHENVLCYKLTYKLDNKYLAKVHVACVKGEKPKITSVFIN